MPSVVEGNYRRPLFQRIDPGSGSSRLKTSKQLISKSGLGLERIRDNKASWVFMSCEWIAQISGPQPPLRWWQPRGMSPRSLALRPVGPGWSVWCYLAIRSPTLGVFFAFPLLIMLGFRNGEEGGLHSNLLRCPTGKWWLYWSAEIESTLFLRAIRPEATGFDYSSGMK